jgi:hypothetical protein
MNFKYSLTLYLLLTLRINALCAQGCKSSSVNLKYVTYKNDSHINRTIFTHFDTFDQLNAKCSQYDVTNFLDFIPRNRLVLDDGFSPRDFLTQQQISSIKCLQLLNLKGFNIHQKVSIKRNEQNKGINLIIFSSEFKFFSNNSLSELTKCDLDTYNNSDNFLNSFDFLKLDNTIYPRVMCPYVFRKSSIKTLMFGDVSNSFLLKNRLNFRDSNNSIMTMLRSIYLEIKYETLDSHNLNKHLFHYLSELSVNGVLNEVETDLFENFFYLKNINFQLENYKNFFHASNNEWMSSMNSRVNVNLSSINDLGAKFIMQKMLLLSFTSLNKMSSFDRDYEYPNEDLCLFQYFPHVHAVFPLIITNGEKLNCTCTIYWLNYYSYVYNRGNFLIGSNITSLICDDALKLSQCDLENRLKKCEITPYLKKESLFKSINDTDILFFIKWLQFILLTILQPLLCGLGIVNNFINLIVIKNKSKKKEFNETMYRFIEINSIFNIFYCLCMSMKLINTCIFDVGSVFCSSIYKTDSSQYFKIIFIFFLGNSFKLSSNVSYLLFSVSRLILINIEKKPVAVAFKKLKKDRSIYYFSAILFVSCVLSLFRLFQYELNFVNDFRKEFPYEIYNEFYCDSSDSGGLVKSKCNLFKFFKLFNSILNDILFVLINLIVDLILVRKCHKYLNKKMLYITDVDHRKSTEKSRKQLNRMIFYNGLLYVFSHLPEFVTTLLLVIYSKKISNYCQYNFSCDLVSEEADVFSLISIVCQFYIFKVFDKNFKISFLDLRQKFLSAITCKNLLQ